MWISAVFVCIGFFVGLWVLRAPSNVPMLVPRTVPDRLQSSEVVSPTSHDDIAEVLATHTPSPKHATSSTTPRQSWRQSWGRHKSFNSGKSSPFDHSRSFYGDSAAKSNASSDKNSAHRRSGADKKSSFSSAGSSTNTDAEEADVLGGIKASLFGRGGGSSRHSSFSHSRVMGQLEIFSHQMRYLGVALRNRRLLAMLAMWMVGNAVYTVSLST